LFCRNILFGNSRVVILLILLSLTTRGTAQLPCFDVTNVCAGSDPVIWETYQCIQGPVNVSDLMGTLLKSQVDATTMQQRIVIKGTLTVDISTASGGYSFVNSSSIIFNDENSEIVVAPGCMLTLDDTEVKGCFRMWKNILVSGGGTLNVRNGCTLSGGINAIRVMPHANISITDNTFFANYESISIGISTGVVKLPVNILSGGGVWGNQISGGNLKPPLANEKSLRGIQLINVANFTIGNSSHAENFISDLTKTVTGETCNGIKAANSDIIIRNTRFANIANPIDPQDDAAIAGVQNSDITLEGLGLVTSTISGGNVGVYLSNSDAEITDAKFSNNDLGVVHNSIIQDPLRRLKIKDCVFKGFKDKGVTITGSCKLSTFEIERSVFDDDEDQKGIREYISVRSQTAIDGSGFKFLNNKFYFRNRPFPGPGSIDGLGVYLTNIHKGLGAGNEFYDEGTLAGGLARTFVGVSMDGCKTFVWEGNNFIGSGISGPAAVSEICFLVSNSTFCQYNCNFLDGFNLGMQFYGDCSGSSIYRNSFNLHPSNAIDFAEDGVVIGGQFKKYNEWNGSGVYMLYTNYNPTNPQHKFRVGRSLFTIHTENDNLPSWANPIRVGNTEPDSNWFKGINTWPPLVDQCPEITIDPTDPKLDLGEKAIIAGNFIPFEGYPANTWDASFSLYHHMTVDPSVRPMGSMEATWYSNNYTSNLGKFYRVFDGFVSLSSSTPNATATQLLLDLNAINVTNVHEQNLKTSLLIFLEHNISQSESYSPQQITQLSAIANQCRFEGGTGVVLARLALGQPSTRVEDCSENFQQRDEGATSQYKAVNIVQTSIFPNPAAHFFHIRLDRNIQNGTARILDWQGRVINNWDFSGGTLEVLDVDITPGMYILEIIQQNQTLSRSKLAFIR
jgi:hypothetical protein